MFGAEPGAQSQVPPVIAVVYRCVERAEGALCITRKCIGKCIGGEGKEKQRVAVKFQRAWSREFHFQHLLHGGAAR